jgi:IKI3 family
VDFRYLSSSSALCCILSDGDILVLKVDSAAQDETVEAIGNVHGGIIAAEWAGDEEALALTTGQNVLKALADLRRIKTYFYDIVLRSYC